MNFRPVLINTRNKKKVGDPIRDARYAPIQDFMLSEDHTFRVDMRIDEAISIMIDNCISGAPVLDKEGRVVGMLSEKDCLQVLLDEAYYNNPLNDHTVADYMTEKVSIIRDDTDLLSVAKAFIESNFRVFPVLDNNNHLVGQVSRKDILKAARKFKETTW